MTRLLHVADLHQGRLTWSKPGPDGIPSAVASVARCWQAAADIAIERQVDVVVLAGDCFDSRTPDSTSLMLFAGPLRELRAARIPVVAIAGNHDRGDPYSILELFEGEGVTVWTTPGIAMVAGIHFGLLPSVGRKRLAAAGAERARGADVDLGHSLEAILGWFANEGVDVVVGHWSVAGCVLGDTELDVSMIDEPLIQPAALEPFIYSAFGHLHRCQLIGSAIDPVGWYSGSIDRMSFSEEHDEKVVLEVELELGTERAIKVIDHPTPARRFLTVGDAFAAPEAFRDAIVRIRAVEEDPNELARWARQEGAAMVTVQQTRAPKVVARDTGMTEQLGPIPALDRWLDLKGVEPGLKTRVLQRAEGLL